MSWSKRTKRLKRELDGTALGDPAYLERYREWDRSMGRDIRMTLLLTVLAIEAVLAIAYMLSNVA